MCVGKRGGTDHLDEAGEVKLVEREGKVRGSGAGLWLGGDGGRRYQICSMLWPDSFWSMSESKAVMRKLMDTVHQCPEPNVAGILVVD